MLTSIAIILLLGLLVGWLFSKIKLPYLLSFHILNIIALFTTILYNKNKKKSIYRIINQYWLKITLENNFF